MVKLFSFYKKNNPANSFARLSFVISVCPFTIYESLLAYFDSSLRGGKAGDGHAEGRAGNVVQTDSMAEFDGYGVAAVLTADTAVDSRSGSLALGNGHLHELTDTGLIQFGKRIVLIDLAIVVSAQELAGVITGETEGHLGQVVGTEAEELGFLGDFVSRQAGTGDLHHGTDFVLEIGTGGGHRPKSPSSSRHTRFEWWDGRDGYRRGAVLP